MDVMIDRDIDPNMKKPLHLWYYQDKTKQGYFPKKCSLFRQNSLKIDINRVCFFFFFHLLEERLKSVTERPKQKRDKIRVPVPVALQTKLTYGKKAVNYMVPLVMPASPGMPMHRRPCGGGNSQFKSEVPISVPQSLPNTSHLGIHSFVQNAPYLPHPHPVRSVASTSNMVVPPIPILSRQMNSSDLSHAPPNVLAPLPIRFPPLIQSTFQLLPQPSFPKSIFPKIVAPSPVSQNSFVVKGNRSVPNHVNGKNCARTSLIPSKTNKNKWYVFPFAERESAGRKSSFSAFLGQEYRKRLDWKVATAA